MTVQPVHSPTVVRTHCRLLDLSCVQQGGFVISSGESLFSSFQGRCPHLRSSWSLAGTSQASSDHCCAGPECVKSVHGLPGLVTHTRVCQADFTKAIACATLEEGGCLYRFSGLSSFSEDGGPSSLSLESKFLGW